VADVKISAGADPGTLVATDKVPLARSASTTAYAATMAELATYANGTYTPNYFAGTPSMDGTGAAGTAAFVARGDHVHPSDTTRMSKAGTTTNDNAAAGQIGEYISSQVLSPGTGLTSLTAANATSISLTAGDWDVWATVGFAANAATTANAYWGSISTVSNTLNTPPGSGGVVNLAGSFPAGLANQTLPVGMMRLSLASTTTIYLVGQSLFAVNTMSAYGFIGARRAR